MSLHSRLAAFAVTGLLSVPLIAGAQGIDVPAINQAKAVGIIDSKAVRTTAERKVNDNLLFAYRAFSLGARRNATVPGVPGFVQGFLDGNTADDQTTFVSVRANSTSSLAVWLQTIGASDVQEYAQFGTVTATIPVSQLLALAGRSEVLTVGPRELATTQRMPVEDLEPRKKAVANAIAAIPNTGAVTWQGVTAHKASLAHQTGITGAGVKVCVLSDGVTHLATYQGTGELPAVDVLSGQAGSGDEGTAMLQIIADMAPGASLGFATGFGGTQASMANNILALQSQRGCNIIVDDVSYLGEEAFSDDFIAIAVNSVTAAGAMYFSSAANSGHKTRNESGTWEGDFNLSATPMPAVISTFEGGQGTLHQFPSGPFTTLTFKTGLVSLKWSDGHANSFNDYDVFVLDSTGTQILGASAFGQYGSGYSPVEVAACTVNGPGPCDDGGTCNTGTGQNCAFPVGSRIYVVNYGDNSVLPAIAPAATRALHLDTNRGRITIADGTTGNTHGHNAASTAVTVAASDVRVLASPPFFTAGDQITFYSSDGPRKIFYNTAGSAITPGNFRFGTNGGTTLQKVDITASDCGATSVTGFTTFCGTSAAAPTAAAIAALVKSANPSATNAQIKTALFNSAIDIEAGGTDRDSGAGIVMAHNATVGILAALTYGKSFSPNPIAQGGLSTLTITVGNPNAVNINGVAFTDSYPVGIANAPSPNAAVSGAGCSGTLSAAGAGNTFGVTNAVIPGGMTCTFTVVVTATGSGVLSDSSGTITTPIGLNTSSPTASLTVTAPTQQRAFVSAFGNDANAASGCGPTTPCRGFTAAASVLIPGGEIVALNAAGYGALTVTKSMTIVANPGFYAGITASSGDAVTIATPGVNVLLRGLNINGTGGTNGINMTAGTSLTVDNCVIANFLGNGIKVDAGGSVVRISNTVLAGNVVDGLQVNQGKADVTRSRALSNGRAGFAAATTAGSTNAMISIVDSFSSGNQYGFYTVANGSLSNARMNATRVTGASNSADGFRVEFVSGAPVGAVAGSLFTQNATTGMSNNGGTLKSLGDNLVDLNGSNTSGAISSLTGQ